MKNTAKFSFIVAILISIFSLIPVNAAQYKFAVKENTANISINQDGSVDIIYDITFQNAKNGKIIDIVDIGLPNNHYDLSTARASIEDNNLSAIKKSTYIPTGVEIPLGMHSIKSGGAKTLHFKIKNDKMIFQDDSDERFAALEFYPNYFGSKFTEGSSKLQVTFILPSWCYKRQCCSQVQSRCYICYSKKRSINRNLEE